jgi:hypothetical protein
MSTVQLERFSVVEFRDLPNGACFVNPLWKDSQLRQPYGQLVWAQHYKNIHKLCGHHIKVDRYGFRDGSHGEGALVFRNEKLVIFGSPILPERIPARPTPEIRLLELLYGLPPLEINLDLLRGNRETLSAKIWNINLTTNLARLIDLGLAYRHEQYYRLTGLGVRQAVRSGFTPYSSHT